MYHKDLHAFRGFAIINIVMAHTGAVFIAQYFINNKQRTSSWDNSFAMSEMLFHDSTLYFAIISGLLLSSVLINKGWPAFFKSKLMNVILPYAFMSALFTIFNYGFKNEGLIIFPFDSISAFFATLWQNILLGTADPQYWYIPTLSVIYLLSPAVWFAAKRSPWVLAALALVPLFMARTATDLSVQTVAYFLGAYCFGIGLGMHYSLCIERLKKWFWGLVAI